MAIGMATSNFWNKKAVFSYVLAVLVFTIHLSTLDNYVPYVGADIKKPLIWFVKVFSRVAVPAFFILSGALFFRNYEPGSFVIKLKSRFKSLVLPYLAWNVIWMLFGWITTIFFSQYFVSRPPSDISLRGVFVSVFLHGDNLPFWFIGNLILFIILSPVVYGWLKNKYVGVVSISSVLAAVYVLNLHYANFLKTWFVDAESIVYYMVGSYIGIHYFHWFADSSRSKAVIGFIVALVCIVSRCTFDFTANDLLGRTLSLTPFALGLFFAFDVIVTHCKQVPEFVNHSFWVFAAHLNFSAVITKLLFFVLPKNMAAAWLNLVITIISTLILIELLNRLVWRFSPKLYSILSGSR